MLDIKSISRQESASSSSPVSSSRKEKSWYFYPLLVVIHLFIIQAAFPKFIYQPKEAMFCNKWDGLKNYFTLQAYVSQPATKEGIFKFNQFGYPFGDYVYYTDNTPFFSIPFRWFCLHIKDVSEYTIPAFNFFMLSNFILCGLLTMWVFKRILKSNGIAFLLAIILPWINMQIPRLWAGHYNLSFSCLPIASIALFLLWYDNRENLKKQLWIAVAMSLFSVASFLIHGYYMAIITAFVSGFLFFYALFTRKEQGSRQRFLMAGLVPALTLAIILLLLKFTDPYLPIRQANANGYDWMEQKTILSQLFTHYSFQRVFFPMYSTKSADPIELGSYLGNIGLYSFGVLFIGCLVSYKFRRQVWAVQKVFFIDPLKKAIFFSGLLLLSISFGEKYYPLKDATRLSRPYSWLSLFSPLELVVYNVLFLVIMTAVIRAVVKWRKPVTTEIDRKPLIKEQIIVTLVAAVLIFLFAGQYTLTLTNIFNPFYYLHFVTKRVEQFRSLARFNWPFFWTFYIWIMYTMVMVFRNWSREVKLALVAGMIILGSIEVTDMVKAMATPQNKDNVFSATSTATIRKMKLDFSKFQAIVPLPFFMVGSEDYQHTIDDNESSSAFAMQTSIVSHLPLMAVKMSRTPPQYGIGLLDMVAKGQIHPDLKKRLNNKPILIVANRQVLHDSTLGNIPNKDLYPEAHSAYWGSINLINRYHLQPIDSVGSFYFYIWQPFKYSE